MNTLVGNINAALGSYNTSATQAGIDGAQNSAINNVATDLANNYNTSTNQAGIDGAQNTAINNFATDLANNYNTTATQAGIDGAQNTAINNVATDLANNYNTTATQAGIDGAQNTAINTAQSTASSAVSVNVTQQTAINDNATNIATNAADIADLRSGVVGLQADMAEGFAMANAMEVFAPDVGSNFRMNVGAGHYDGVNALGVTLAGRLNAGSTIVYLGASRASGTTSGKAGVSLQW